MHDLTLLWVKYSWAIQELSLCLSIAKDSSYEINYQGVSHLEISHLSPWGDSSSINSYSESVLEGDVYIANLEIQSGDVISFKYKRRTTSLPSISG